MCVRGRYTLRARGFFVIPRRDFVYTQRGIEISTFEGRFNLVGHVSDVINRLSTVSNERSLSRSVNYLLLVDIVVAQC